MDRYIGGQMDRWVDGWIFGYLVDWLSGKMSKWISGQSDRWVVRWVGERSDRTDGYKFYYALCEAYRERCSCRVGSAECSTANCGNSKHVHLQQTRSVMNIAPYNLSNPAKCDHHLQSQLKLYHLQFPQRCCKRQLKESPEEINIIILYAWTMTATGTGDHKNVYVMNSEMCFYTCVF